MTRAAEIVVGIITGFLIAAGGAVIGATYGWNSAIDSAADAQCPEPEFPPLVVDPCTRCHKDARPHGVTIDAGPETLDL